jgi:hypothetical protein
MVTKDMVNHITTQHGYLFKVFSHRGHVNSWFLTSLTKSPFDAYECRLTVYEVLFSLP